MESVNSAATGYRPQAVGTDRANDARRNSGGVQAPDDAGHPPTSTSAGSVVSGSGVTTPDVNRLERMSTRQRVRSQRNQDDSVGTA